jgi:argininosuccinate synthase
MTRKKCVLAYSGGLDTSAIVVWLLQQRYEIHAVLVDVGQEEDLPALRQKALRMGATSAVIRDAVTPMCRGVLGKAIGLAATYEGTYRLGTALARPFIAAEQVAVARELGGATLVHGATGKGNDQIRFEFAYRSLVPECPVLAPWKVWDLQGRQDLIDFLKSHGFEDHYETTKDFSFDENLWHLSVEGGPLEDSGGELDIEKVLDAVSDRFSVGPIGTAGVSPVEVTFAEGVPVAVNGREQPLDQIIRALNHEHRFAPWGWDLVIENRFTGIKSRGLYINPAAKLLQVGADALARTCLNKPTYDAYVELGRAFGNLIYRGEYFSDQRVVLDATAEAVLRRMNGVVTVRPYPVLHASRITTDDAIFRRELATFAASDYDHADAKGFINLSWLGAIGRPFEGQHHGTLAAASRTASDVCVDQRVSEGRLVPAAV